MASDAGHYTITDGGPCILPGHRLIRVRIEGPSGSTDFRLDPVTAVRLGEGLVVAGRQGQGLE